MTEFSVEVIRSRCHVRTALARAQAEYGKTVGATPEGVLWLTRIKESPPPTT
jgi:hypothetical protein